MNWNGFGSSHAYNWGTVLVFAWRDWGTLWKTSVRVASVPARSKTSTSLLNTTLELYCYDNLFGGVKEMPLPNSRNESWWRNHYIRCGGNAMTQFQKSEPWLCNHYIWCRENVINSRDLCCDCGIINSGVEQLPLSSSRSHCGITITFGMEDISLFNSRSLSHGTVTIIFGLEELSLSNSRSLIHCSITNIYGGKNSTNSWCESCQYYHCFWWGANGPA
jgi:hypothetical protein